MEQEWLKLLSRLGETAKQLSSEVPSTLTRQDLTRHEAERLWAVIGNLCDQVADLIELMNDHDADEALIDAGESLEDVFLSLHETVGHKAIDLGSDLKIH